MDHIHHTSPEITAEPSFGQRFVAVTERSLSPENIETYADDALRDVIDVVSDAVAVFADRDQPITAELERQALSQCGLDPNTIETTLDRISFVADEIRELDTLLEDVTIHVDTVITPPDSRNVNILSSDGSFQEKHTISRFKTVTFLLHNRFGVDLKDSEQITITAGALRGDMMRNKGYKMLQLPELNRTILVCDEEDNATFVFDSKKLADNGISSEEFTTMTKDDLNEYLSLYSGAGTRLVYSDKFVEEFAGLIEIIPDHNEKIELDEMAGKLLKKVEHVPEGYLSVTGIANDLNFDREAVSRVIRLLGDTLGEVQFYKFKHGPAIKAYSPAQRAMIRQSFEKEGAFNVVDDGYKPFAAIALELFGSLQRRGSIDAAVKALGDELGEVVIAKNNTSRRALPQYSPAQQAMIKTWLEANGHLTPRPEGYAPVNTIATRFGVTGGVIGRAIAAMGPDRLGLPIRAIGDRTPTDHYSPVQQDAIYKYLQERGYFSEAPEGYLPVMQLAKTLNLTSQTIDRAIDELGTELGLATVAKSINSAKPSRHYSPSQQQKIFEWLQINGRAKTRAKLAKIALDRAYS